MMPARITTALIGAGYRGSYLLSLLLQIPEFVLVGVAEPKPSESIRALGVELYEEGEDDYKRMIDMLHPELVIIASPWDRQIAHAEYAVSAGAHIALEVRGGLELGEYDLLKLLVTKHRRRVYPLENVLFREEIMALSRMRDAGLLGDMVYLRGGYRHDLRELILGRSGGSTDAESHWRAQYYQGPSANLYPSHGFAPLALLSGLLRWDSPLCLSSFASKARGIYQGLSDRGLAPQGWREPIGDVISTEIRTASGTLITLLHDTTLPRPRSLDLEVQGSRGIWQGEGRRIYIEGRSPQEEWESDQEYLRSYRHPSWERWGEEARRRDQHHGGMDYVMLRRVVADLQGEESYPATLDDLVLWSSVSPLSRISIAESRSVSFFS